MRITDPNDWTISVSRDARACIGWSLFGALVMLVLIAAQSPLFRLALWIGGFR